MKILPHNASNTMPFRSLIAVLVLALASAAQAEPPARAAEKTRSDGKTKQPAFAGCMVPFLEKYCIGCHGGAKPKAGLALDVLKDEAALAGRESLLDKMLQKVRAREMPPKSRPQPTQREIDLAAAWFDAWLDRAHGKDPGRVTVRRLNKVEYQNTIRDLIGIEFPAIDDFPSDDIGYGFDNIGDVLSLPPLLMEKYVVAADKIVVQAIVAEEPAARPLPESHRRILFCRPADSSKEDCARKVLEKFAARAYRRPVKPRELDRLLDLVKLAESQGDSFEKGIQLALKAVLVSPHFLFRVELDAEPDNPKAIHAIGNHELASRLSYFLWSSMPDDELFDQARQGTLRKNLDAQVRRMLQDQKARALVEHFAGQWLQTRNLKTATPDPDRFRDFDEALRSAMLKETGLFFEAIVKEDRSVLDLVDADFTFVNERLARHYNMPGIVGNEFRRVALKGDQRGGVLTQASILTITSHPTRTSPVKRGKWILENLLGEPPPPPPPDVPELKEDEKAVQSGSLRQRMEQHRANPTCAACHQRMDPLGFGLENFDAVGAWRARDGNVPVDATGILPGGQSFQGPRELKAILKSRKDAFARCLTEKLLTYALGRGLEYYDRKAVDRIAGAVAKSDYRFSALVLEIVKSDPFQKRRGSERPGAATKE